MARLAERLCDVSGQRDLCSTVFQHLGQVLHVDSLVVAVAGPWSNRLTALFVVQSGHERPADGMEFEPYRNSAAVGPVLLDIRDNPLIAPLSNTVAGSTIL